MRREKPGQTLQTTALVNEAFLRLVSTAAAGRDSQLVALDEALESLSRTDPRKAKVVEYRYFGGLSVEETAEVLKISPQSVLRDWKLARAWLMRELASPGGC